MVNDSGSSASTPLAEVAAQIYGLPLEEFTAERNARARNADNKEVANQIKRLPKPSMTGWLINMLVHHRRPAVDEALALGVELRNAQENLDQKRMKDLGQQRQRLLAGLGKDSLALAKELGHGVSASVASEVEQTFRAAMTDPNAATAVASGRLLRALTASGWDAVDLEGAVGGPFEGATIAQAAGSATTSGADDDALLADARADLEDAQGLLADADDDAQDAARRVTKLEDRRKNLSTEIEDLQRRIAGLRTDQKVLDGQIDDAETERASLARAARDAQRAVDRAKRQLDKLR